MAINPNQLSPELQNIVLVNGTVDLDKLRMIADNRDHALAAEASKLLQAELNGQKADGDIGDTLEVTTTNKAGKYIADWWTDKDKVSTDGKDDGNISTGEKLESLAKGFTGGIVKNIVKNPVESAVAIGGTAAAAYGATAALTALGVAAAGPIVAAGLVLVGLGFGAKAIYDGLKEAKEADSDGVAKAGYEEAGTGAAVVTLSAFGGRKLGKSKSTKPANKALEGAKPAPETTKPVEPQPTNTAKTVEAKPAKREPLIKYDAKGNPIKYDAEGKIVKTADAAEPAKTKIVTMTELQRKAVLDKAGFTEDVIANLKNEKFSYGKGQLENTLRMVEYLERQIANGKEITPSLIREAIKECDGPYAQPGYGRLYQAEQLEILNKYWSGAEKARAAYLKDGKFLTESEELSTNAIKRQAIYDKAGFTKEVLAELEHTKFSYGKGQLENTLKIVEYLEGRIAKGEKLSYMMLREAIKACDDIYANGSPGYGYGGQYQNEQLGILAKYWVHGKELMEVCK